MLKKVLASIGIGGAKVDTIINTDKIVQGGKINGTIQMFGGSVEQEINQISLNLMTKVKQECEDSYVYRSYIIESFFVNSKFVLKPNEKLEKTFEFDLHPETPITAFEKWTESKVWLETSLGIDFAYDPTDKDYLSILPGSVAKHILDFMKNQNFKLAKADVESGYLRSRQFKSRSGFYQEIEFVPKGFGFFGVKEIELSIIQDTNQTQVFIELDKAFASDSYSAITFRNTDDYEIISRGFTQMFPSIFKKSL